MFISSTISSKLVLRFEDLSITSDLLSKDQQLPDVNISPGAVYLGKDPNYPAIGDVKIRFQVVRPQDATVLAQQLGRSFGEWSQDQDLEYDLMLLL